MLPGSENMLVEWRKQNFVMHTYLHKAAFVPSLSYQPLTLSVLAALVPEEMNAEITLVDEGVQNPDYGRERFDLVCISLILSGSAIRASRTVTKVAILSWAGSLGGPVQLLSSLFVLLAIFTSFWAIALALGEMTAAQFPRLEGTPGFIAVTLPSLFITFIGGAGFLSFTSVTGGAVAVIVALLLLPAYRNARREEDCHSLLGPAGDSKPITALVGAGYLLMAAGSLISV